MTEKSCCGNCKHHKKNEDGEWVCNGIYADMFGLETEYDYCCEDYEERRK